LSIVRQMAVGELYFLVLSIMATLFFGMGRLCAGDIIDSSHAGFFVDSNDQGIFIRSPSGNKVTLTDATCGGATQPGEVICSWDPAGKWVVVFAPDHQSTEIFVCDLKKLTSLREQPTQFDAYPDWYQNAHAVTSKPLSWHGDQLMVLTEATTRPSGIVRKLKQTLKISENSYILKPCLGISWIK